MVSRIHLIRTLFSNGGFKAMTCGTSENITVNGGLVTPMTVDVKNGLQIKDAWETCRDFCR